MLSIKKITISKFVVLLLVLLLPVIMAGVAGSPQGREIYKEIEEPKDNVKATDGARKLVYRDIKPGTEELVQKGSEAKKVEEEETINHSKSKEANKETEHEHVKHKEVQLKDIEREVVHAKHERHEHEEVHPKQEQHQHQHEEVRTHHDKHEAVQHPALSHNDKEPQNVVFKLVGVKIPNARLHHTIICKTLDDAKLDHNRESKALLDTETGTEIKELTYSCTDQNEEHKIKTRQVEEGGSSLQPEIEIPPNDLVAILIRQRNDFIAAAAVSEAPLPVQAMRSNMNSGL